MPNNRLGSYVSESTAMSYKHKLVLILLAVSLLSPAFADETQKYVSSDGKLQALVIPVGKAGDGLRESRVEIRDSGGKILRTRSFASKDGEHGYIVSHAAWTPDSEFFVFSVYSSGGHQPWHTPTYFYRRSNRQLKLLDDYLGPITDPNFELSAPDILRTSKLKAYGDLESIPVEIKLSNLVKQRSKR